jgi:serine/threonine protein kinase
LPRTFGDYELLEEIARGGMGIVFKARQRRLDRIVVVKLILAGEFANKEQALRFRVEAETAARLQHPNIVRIHETGEQDGQPYFSMDYVEGGNLAALVREKPIPAKCAARYVKTIAEAIQYAHEQGILHRDLKPSNVLIDQAGQPHVTDFGLAKRMQQESFLTVTGDVMGSPNFMPPEQAGYGSRSEQAQPEPREGRNRTLGGTQPLVTSATKTRAGRYSDVYGLGAILFYLVTGRPPFVAGNVVETLHHVLNTEPVSPRLLNPSVPQDIATICLKCLEKEPAKRFQTAQQLADELSRFLNDEPIHARPTSRLEQVWRWCRRKPALASVLAGLCLVFTIAFASVTWQWRRAESALALVKTILKQSESEDDDDVVYTGCFSRDRRKEFRIHLDGSASLTVSLQPVPYPLTFPFNHNDPYFAQSQGRTTNDVRTMLLWPASGASAAEKNVKTQKLRMARFSASGEFLAIVQTGRGVQLWDAILGKLLIPFFQSDEGDIISAGFTPDSSFLVTRSDSGDIGVWNVRTGERQGNFRFQSPRESTVPH